MQAILRFNYSCVLSFINHVVFERLKGLLSEALVEIGKLGDVSLRLIGFLFMCLILILYFLVPGFYI